ncbi:MAG: hypothetical protein WCJ63_08820, partial [Actinomycetes bacterium]
ASRMRANGSRAERDTPPGQPTSSQPINTRSGQGDGSVVESVDNRHVRRDGGHASTDSMPNRPPTSQLDAGDSNRSPPMGKGPLRSPFL